MPPATSTDAFVPSPPRPWWPLAGDGGARQRRALASELVVRCGLGPGQRGLDLAAGDIEVALAIALSGASPEACDVAPDAVADGRARCAERGEWEIPWDVAEFDGLPYAAGRFDAVLSLFGLPLAPDPRAAIVEAFRVTRSGGAVGVASWTPGSPAERFDELAAAHVRRAEPSPFLWGDESACRELLAPHAAGVSFERRSLTCAWPDAPAARAAIERSGGLLGAALGALSPERREALLDEAEGLLRSLGSSTDGGISLTADYALAVARKPG